ncbi:thiamine-phosphate kinase [Gemmatimonadota bacterium]
MKRGTTDGDMGPLGPEFRLIEILTGRLGPGAPLPGEGLAIGIGDDAAAWEIAPGVLGLLTIDTVVEGVHAFPHEPPEGVGARALTAAVSDIPAMGGTPLVAVIGLQVPVETEDRQLEQLYEGIREEADLLGIAVVGGDVVDTPGPLATSVAVFGTVRSDRLWRRSGAQAGDVVAVTGRLGGSRAGVELLALERDMPPGEWAAALIERHIRPHARVRAAAAINRHGGVNSAIDISDGLSSEAWHLALDSGVQLTLEADAIPICSGLEEYLQLRARERGEMFRGDDTACYALDSGEEFELLLTLPPDHPALDEEDLDGDGPLTVIGHVSAGQADVILQERSGLRSIRPGGWSHRKSDGGEG